MRQPARFCDVPGPDTPSFKQDARIRPVAPFLEVFVVSENDVLEPLTLDLLRREGLDETKVSWRAHVANRKVFRRTTDENDIVRADTGWFSGHERRRLEGHCANFVRSTDFIDFGDMRFVRPTARYPEIRLRFTPAKGLIYGPNTTRDGKSDPAIDGSRAIYDANKGSWCGFGGDKETAEFGKLPQRDLAAVPLRH